MRFTWASYGMYALAGTTAVLLGAVMPEFLRHYHVSYAVGGQVVFMQAMGFFVGVPLALRAMHRWPARNILSLSALVIGLTQVGLCTLPPLAAVYPLAALNGGGGSALETVVASLVMEIMVHQRAIFMSRLEVSFGAGALGLPILAGALITLDAWRLTFLCIGLAGLGLALWWQVIVVPREPVTSTHRDASMVSPPSFAKRSTKFGVLAIFLYMTLVYVGLEASINSFLPSLFTAGLSTPASTAALSSSTFWAAMVIGRLSIGWIARALRYDHYLWVSISLSLVILIAFSIAHSQAAGFVLVFCLGLAMAPVYSVLMVFTNHTFPGMTRIITSLLTASAGLGGAVFPALMGLAMNHLPVVRVPWLLAALAGMLWIGLLSVFVILRYWLGRAPRPSSCPDPP